MYGLPEHYRKQIAQAKILANPGCYVTSVLLPLLPLFKAEEATIEWVIVDSKSGVSGAGRALKQNTHFCEAHENFSAYSVGHAHRHTPEMEQELSLPRPEDGDPDLFAPSPADQPGHSFDDLHQNSAFARQECSRIAASAYDKRTVRPYPGGGRSARHPQRGMYELTATSPLPAAANGRPVIAVSTLDNLIKGASGQAVQNMNIMFGFPETTGLAPVSTGNRHS